MNILDVKGVDDKTNCALIISIKVTVKLLVNVVSEEALSAVPMFFKNNTLWFDRYHGCCKCFHRCAYSYHQIS